MNHVVRFVVGEREGIWNSRALIVDEPGKMGGGLELTSSSLMNQVRWKEVWNSPFTS